MSESDPPPLGIHVTETVRTHDRVVGNQPVAQVENICAVRMMSEYASHGLLPHEPAPSNPRLQVGGLTFAICKHCGCLFQLN